MSNILVTGGLGFIGHNVASLLESKGHNVFIVDNCTDYGIIPKEEIAYLSNERAKKVETYWKYKYNVCDYSTMRWLFASNNFDIVIHLASFPRQKVVNSDPVEGSRVMNSGLINLLHISNEFNIKKFVYVSSSMVYGDFDDNVKEDAICNPQGTYGIMKYTGELLTKDFVRNREMNYTIIRPSAVYGPLDVIDRVIAKFMLNAIRDEALIVNGATEKLDFSYVDDVANGIVMAALSDNTANKTYNITRGVSRSLLEAAELVVKIVGKGSIEVFDKDENFPSRGSLCIDNAKNDFGYDPTIDIEQGFQRYYDWLKNSTFYNRDE